MSKKKNVEKKRSLPPFPFSPPFAPTFPPPRMGVRYRLRGAPVAGAPHRPAGDAEVAALAAVDAGLKPDTLTKEEQLRFRGVKRTEYLEAR